MAHFLKKLARLLQKVAHLWRILGSNLALFQNFYLETLQAWLNHNRKKYNRKISCLYDCIDIGARSREEPSPKSGRPNTTFFAKRTKSKSGYYSTLQFCVVSAQPGVGNSEYWNVKKFS